MTKKRQKPTRHQHLIPASYLARFTFDGNRNSPFQIFDVKRRVLRDSTPDATAHQRDFYAVERVPGMGRNDVEDQLAILEGKWAKSLSHVIAKSSFVSNDLFTEVMSFTAFLVVRTRRFRALVSNFVNQNERAQFSTSIATDDGWTKFRTNAIHAIKSEGRHLTRAEREILDDPDGFRRFVNSSAEIEFEQTWYVQLMIKCALNLAFALGERHWSIWVANQLGAEFVCSDSPVCLTWKSVKRKLWPPGFQQQDTWVTIPLCRTVAIVGSYEPQLELHAASIEDIAWLNSLTSRYASEVYGTDLRSWEAKD